MLLHMPATRCIRLGIGMMQGARIDLPIAQKGCATARCTASLQRTYDGLLTGRGRAVRIPAALAPETAFMQLSLLQSPAESRQFLQPRTQ